MERIANVQALVFKALVERPETRADDHLLVLEVYKHFISGETSIQDALTHHRALKLPSFASIARSRRKLQRKYPELVNAKAAKIREKAEKEYRAYALNS